MADEWMAAMKRGDFEAAWQVSDRNVGIIPPDEWRRPRHEQRIWNGTPVEGQRVLVRCYHGLGDTLQFLRYLPRLARVTRELTVWIQPPLIPLLEGTPQLGRLLPLHDGTPDVSYDVDLEIMELAHVFRTSLASIPREVPYIRVPRRFSREGALRVGLAWRAGDWDPRRSVALSELEPLFTVPGVRVVPLHGRGAHEARWFGEGDGIMPLAALAEVMASCDVVVTVDTMAAHLAGALGATTCVMLHADADWRWMEGRSDSPWYPTATLYRQSRMGDWRTVVDAVRARLLEEQTRAERQRA
jgi:hypothetical protein